MKYPDEATECFDFILAEALSMPVWMVRQVIPQGEYIDWQVFRGERARYQKDLEKKAIQEAKTSQKKKI